MKYSEIPSATNLVLNFKSKGIKDIVISPGSRNAPLILSFTADSFFNCYSIVDERSAAFFGLGMAQNQRRPVAVVCTSGSALLNYYPAVAEAYYSEIPLVVVSADRPPYKIDVGDGQTIRQDNVFDRHIGYSANLKLDVGHAEETIKKFAPELLNEDQSFIEKYNQEETFKALNVSLVNKLPVHINIPFEEPLYGLKKYEGLEDISEQQVEIVEGDIADLDSLQKSWHFSPKKMVLVGVNHPKEIDKGLLEKLAKDPSVLVFTETTSNLHHPNFFPSIDSIIIPIEKAANKDERFKALQPDILLTFGGLIVSKKIKAFLRNYKPKHHWHVNETRAFDTYFALTRHFKTNPQKFLGSLLTEQGEVKSNYFREWNTIKESYIKKRDSYYRNSEFSDYKVFGEVLASIPKNYQLQLSNSSIVRYAQLFDIDPSIKVYCNRGASGIDGSTSTAVGAAFKNENPTLLITGDLSFFYDSNALWNNYLRKDFRIILINNSGGGIFRILPGNDKSDTFEKFFETRQEYSASHLCKLYGIEYFESKNLLTLKERLQNFYNNSEQPKLLEIFTPRTMNDKILLGYFDFISSSNH